MSDEFDTIMAGGGSDGATINQTNGPSEEAGSAGRPETNARGESGEAAQPEHRASDAEARAAEQSAEAEHRDSAKRDSGAETKPTESIIDQLFPQAKAATQNGKASKGRDYTGLTPDEVEVFKSMSNTAYDRLRPLFDRHKSGDFVSKAEYESAIKKAQAAQRYEDHEEGYTLSNTYREVAKQRDEAQQLITFAEEQLKSARAGEKFSWFNRDASGNYSLRPDQYEPTPQAIAELQKWIDGQYRAYQGFQTKLDSIKGEHNASHKSYAQVWQDINQKFTQGETNPAFKAAVERNLEAMFPPSHRGRPESRTLAAAAVLINQLLNERGQRTHAANRKNGAPAASELSGGTGDTALADQLYKAMLES